MILPIPGELDGELRRTVAGSSLDLNRLAVREEPERRFRRGTDQRGHFKDCGPIQFFRKLNGHGKLQRTVAWRIGRRGNVEFHNLELRLRSRDARRFRFRQPIAWKKRGQADADTKEERHISQTSSVARGTPGTHEETD